MSLPDRRSRGQSGLSIVETLVALAVGAIVIGPVGAWMMLIFSTQAPAAAGLTDAGESRVLDTFVTRDVTSAERLVAAGPPPLAEPLVTCAGAPGGADVLLNVYDLGSASSVLVYGTVDESGGSKTLYRWTCDLSVDHVVQEETVVLRNLRAAGAVCEDDPDQCERITLKATLGTGYETSVTASRRARAAEQEGFGGSSVPVAFIQETGRTGRTPGSPMTVDLTGTAVDADTPLADLSFEWSVAGPGAASLTSTAGATTTFSTFIAGDYTVTLEVYDGLNTATLPFSIEVVNVPPAITAASCSDVGPDLFTCTANASDPDTNSGVDFEWRYPSDPIGGEQSAFGDPVSIPIDPVVPGLVVVELRATDDEGGQAVRYIELERASNPPTGPIVLDPEPVLLPGLLPRLLNTDGDDASRTAVFSTVTDDTQIWELLDDQGTVVADSEVGDDGFDSLEFSHVFGQGASGAHTIRRTTTNLEVEEIRFRVNAPPVAGFSVSAVQGNAPQTLTFTDASSDDVGFSGHIWDLNALGPFGGQWMAGGTSVSQTFSEPGTYTVRMVVTDIDGLSSTVSKPVVIPGVPSQPEPPAWPSAPPYDRVTFAPVPGATGYVVEFVNAGTGGCINTVQVFVAGGGPFEAAEGGTPCAGGSTEASLAVRANAATGPFSIATPKP
jgi:hypothetical protein